ncbi:hypothetical protein BpHYR1_040145, partial [Brachionus plicatilis]
YSGSNKNVTQKKANSVTSDRLSPSNLSGHINLNFSKKSRCKTNKIAKKLLNIDQKFMLKKSVSSVSSLRGKVQQNYVEDHKSELLLNKEIRG